jgi:aspartate/glutamate racemase
MIRGGFVTYGKVAGILMLRSTIPRIPGDPGHAQTFRFPVTYAAVEGLPFADLVDGRFDHVDAAIDAAGMLEAEGVSFVAADCGLFSLYQQRIAARLSIPFIGSALSLVPLLASFLPPSRSVGVLTGHAGMLKDIHLLSAGADPARTIVAGLEDSAEFRKVVIERGNELDVEAMRQDAREAAAALAAKAAVAGTPLGAVVVECTNLVSFRHEIREAADAPVYDLVSLVEFHASGFMREKFEERYVSLRKG